MCVCVLLAACCVVSVRDEIKTQLIGQTKNERNEQISWFQYLPIFSMRKLFFFLFFPIFLYPNLCEMNETRFRALKWISMYADHRAINAAKWKWTVKIRARIIRLKWCICFVSDVGCVVQFDTEFIFIPTNFHNKYLSIHHCEIIATQYFDIYHHFDGFICWLYDVYMLLKYVLHIFHINRLNDASYVHCVGCQISNKIDDALKPINFMITTCLSVRSHNSATSVSFTFFVEISFNSY